MPAKADDHVIVLAARTKKWYDKYRKRVLPVDGNLSLELNNRRLWTRGGYFFLPMSKPSFMPTANRPIRLIMICISIVPPRFQRKVEIEETAYQSRVAQLL